MPAAVITTQIAAGEQVCMAQTIDHELYTWGFEGVTGHGGKFMSRDCPVPRKLELEGSIHSMSAGAQHGALVVTPKPKTSDSPKKEPK